MHAETHAADRRHYTVRVAFPPPIPQPSDLPAGLGLIGFTGVILTLLWNAWIARRAREATIRHDRKALRIALRAELTVLRGIYSANAERANDAAEQGRAVLVPLDPFTSVYDSQISRLGLLSYKEIEKLIPTYAGAKELPKTIAARWAEQTPKGTLDGFAIVSSQKLPIIASLSQQMMQVVDETLQVLEFEN